MSENKKGNIEKQEEIKQIHPETDVDNYLIQIISSDGKSIIKQIIVNNAMVKIQYLGEQSFAIETK